MEKLKITIIQPDMIWENPGANLKKYAEMISEIDATDIIVFPEMFTTGFSMQPIILKEKMDGVAVNWMKKLQPKKNAAVIGSLIIEDGDKIFNRAVWVFLTGRLKNMINATCLQWGRSHFFILREMKKLLWNIKAGDFAR
ncbi:MAG: hypothetical protein IPF54_21895 [Draconibacterium sp.]|nr:hypothetical protein [Draconibacterium sp.]